MGLYSAIGIYDRKVKELISLCGKLIQVHERFNFCITDILCEKLIKYMISGPIKHWHLKGFYRFNFCITNILSALYYLTHIDLTHPLKNI